MKSKCTLPEFYIAHASLNHSGLKDDGRKAAQVSHLVEEIFLLTPLESKINL
jgi:hypothetical protein